jgi:hypothetical protein
MILTLFPISSTKLLTARIIRGVQISPSSSRHSRRNTIEDDISAEPGIFALVGGNCAIFIDPELVCQILQSYNEEGNFEPCANTITRTHSSKKKGASVPLRRGIETGCFVMSC